MGTDHFRSSETSLFGKTRSAVLSLLFGHLNESFYLRQIVSLVGTGVGAVQRELVALQGLGIIESKKMGNQNYFRANPRSPIYIDIKNIVQKMEGWVEILRESLEVIKEDVALAFVYGSYATHTQTAASDVDLLVVGDVDEMCLHRTISDVEQKIAKTINYTLLTAKEYAKRSREKEGFIARLLKGQKIKLIGGTHEV